MTATSRPGTVTLAEDSNRAGKIVLGRTISHTTETNQLQRRADPPCRIVGWRVSKWLAVEVVEVTNG
jgi:hypothetical protein